MNVSETSTAKVHSRARELSELVRTIPSVSKSTPLLPPTLNRALAGSQAAGAARVNPAITSQAAVANGVGGGSAAPASLMPPMKASLNSAGISQSSSAFSKTGVVSAFNGGTPLAGQSRAPPSHITLAQRQQQKHDEERRHEQEQTRLAQKAAERQHQIQMQASDRQQQAHVQPLAQPQPQPQTQPQTPLHRHMHQPAQQQAKAPHHVPQQYAEQVRRELEQRQKLEQQRLFPQQPQQLVPRAQPSLHVQGTAPRTSTSTPGQFGAAAASYVHRAQQGMSALPASSVASLQQTNAYLQQQIQRTQDHVGVLQQAKNDRRRLLQEFRELKRREHSGRATAFTDATVASMNYRLQAYESNPSKWVRSTKPFWRMQRLRRRQLREMLVDLFDTEVAKNEESAADRMSTELFRGILVNAKPLIRKKV